MNEESSYNSPALLSLIFGLAVVLSCCGGIVPLPLTGFVCFPAGFCFSLLALIFGVVGLNQIRARGQAGAPMAWTGVLIGGAVFACVLAAILLLAALFYFAPESLPTPLRPDLYQF